jgi:hypothetical protein
LNGGENPYHDVKEADKKAEPAAEGEAAVESTAPKAEKAVEAAPAKEEAKPAAKEAAPAKEEAPAAEAAPAKEAPAAEEKPAAFVQRPGKDIGKTGYDRDVYHFVREDTNVQPTPYPKKETPFDYNGSDPRSHAQKFFYKPRKDIGEKGIDEEVHGFASSDTMVQGTPLRRSETAYLPNGSSNVYPAKFYYRPRKDIGENGIDEEVHGFASSDTMVQGTPLRRSEVAYLPNGSSNVYPSKFTGVRFMKPRPKKDIGE